MRKPTRTSLTALIVLIVLGTAAPAWSATPQEQQVTIHSRRVAVLTQINALKATDSQLVGAVDGLTAAVTAQLNVADAALAGVKAALARQAAANAAVRATRNQIASLRAEVVAQAVEEYMRPQGDETYLTGVASLNELSQRSMFLNEITSKNSDALDAMKVAQSDLLVEQRAATQARLLADKRQAAATDALTQLELTRAAKQRLQASLTARIAGYQAESTALAAQEGSIEAMIRQQELAAAAQSFVSTGSGVSSYGLIWPLSGPITSPFGMRWGKLHPGIDIGVPIGTPIHAAKAGVVIYASWMSGYGNFVIIDHGGGFSTAYGHQSRLAVTVGEQVSQGQVIGFSGDTGNSTGPHLHFETRVNGIPENPMNFLP
jgi:murein DD-endopeptidase MepM/ murein hydrolase activator NlpD